MAETGTMANRERKRPRREIKRKRSGTGCTIFSSSLSGRPHLAAQKLSEKSLFFILLSHYLDIIRHQVAVMVIPFRV